jgi:hypothetical protein
MMPSQPSPALFSNDALPFSMSLKSTFWKCPFSV